MSRLLFSTKYSLRNQSNQQQQPQQQQLPTPTSFTPAVTKQKVTQLLEVRRDRTANEKDREKERTPNSGSIKGNSIENILSFSTTSSIAKAYRREAVPVREPETFDDLFTTKLSINNFNLLHVVGKGGFGKVWKVESKRQRIVYALKEMSKSRILSKRSVNSVMNERYLLSYLKHQYLVNMICAFQDRDNVYLVMDLLTGGDLRFHICKRRRFTEEQTKFVIACIVVALEYLHNNGILHRDIKPENIVLDAKGFCRVTDLGIARVWRPDNSQDTSGTPGYMAPEVLCRQNHGIAVDYFALGVIAYEMMIGKRPYLGKDRKEIKEAILARQVQIKNRQEIPDGWSNEAADFVNRLIQRKPANRLGTNGPEEVKNHPWLKNFPWTKLMSKELVPPFQPSKREEENFEAKQMMYDDMRDPYADLDRENALLLRRDSVQALFNGYTYEN
eukprot:TRINITY_DN1659_c0_g1_i4.p1 TRINITY_DN1659_c0_g1~~TRINITY_DN1659_c0_g1_i4.p1  ORF type:complete len:445 (-),score=86.95 TRINITY_DN1659_c0_g1_i4:143-1477(-)